MSKKIRPFFNFCIENFPFIEATYEAMENYELWSKVVEKLNEVIDNTNKMGEIVDKINNYFINLDVQEEINNKLDELARNGTLENLIGNYCKPRLDNQDLKIENIENNLNDTKKELTTKINSAVSGSPLVASSVEEMTDTSRVYVNTTDGNWYYYNGSNWLSGGTYQGTEISNIDLEKVEKIGIITDFSNTIEAWGDAEILNSGNKTITFKTKSSGDSGFFIKMNEFSDSLKNLYLYLNLINVVGRLDIFLYDGWTPKKHLTSILSGSPKTNTVLYIDDMSDYSEPRVLFRGDEGQLTYILSNIYFSHFNQYKLKDSLINNLLENQNTYDNIKQNFNDIFDISKFEYQGWGDNCQIQNTSNDSFLLETDYGNNIGSRGICTPLNNDFSKNLIIEFDLTVPDNYNLDLYIANHKGINYSNFISLQPTEESEGHRKYNINLQYYKIYENYDEYSIWFMVSTTLATSRNKFIEINNFKMYISDISELNIYADNFNDLIKKIQNAINNVNVSVSSSNYINGIDGKYYRQISNGQEKLINVIPNKATFFGNSLLIGQHHGENYFGMCASSKNNDYYHYVTDFITNKKPNASFNKFSSVGLEESENFSDIENWINNASNYINNETELIILQLGDNINTTEKQNNFNTHFKTVLARLRNLAPNSRIVVVAMWYFNQNVMNTIKNICNETGTQYVDISGLNITSNQGFIGQVITFDDGYQYTVSDSGIASHPGDSGMLAIANKIINEIF